MYLPTELHDQILQYFSKEDLPSYRLICRDFTHHASLRLFRLICFRTSLSSLKRLAGISSHPNIGCYVQTLVWDAETSEYDAESFLEGLRMRELNFLLDGLSSRQTFNDMSSVEEQTEDEPIELSRSLGVFILHSIFMGFPNLNKLYIRSHPFRHEAGVFWGGVGGKRTFPHKDDVWNCSEEPKDQHGRPICRYCRSSSESTGRYEMQTALLAAHLAGCSVSKLRVGILKWRRLPYDYFWPAISLKKAYEKLTSVRILIKPTDRYWSTATSKDVIDSSTAGCASSFKAFLSSMPNLQSIDLKLDEGTWYTAMDFKRSGILLQDILPAPSTVPYPSLRKIILDSCNTSQDFLLRFLNAHSATLKVLKMQFIKLDPSGTWLVIFPRMRQELMLEEVWMDGYFDNNTDEGVEWWCLDGKMGKALEEYLLRKDVAFPLAEENKGMVERIN